MRWWTKSSAYPMGDGVKIYEQRGFEYHGEEVIKPYIDVP